MSKASVRSSKLYSAIFKVDMPIEFFFNKKGMFDGIGVDVEKATKEERYVIEQLCRKIQNFETYGFGEGRQKE